ncbi:ArsR/SmtB family transcription factor [Tistrella mobilis]|uniref:ArsR/SmtB family transcription factor n=1 Tax=Tistrella mobilis TaxID=171437 RepID=UPI003556B87B
MEKTEVITALAALAHEARLDIFRLLVQAGPEGLPAGQIAQAIGLAAPTASFHLAQLKQAGLVACRRESRSLIYTAAFDRMAGLVGFLTENCCGGNPAACGLPHPGAETPPHA